MKKIIGLFLLCSSVAVAAPAQNGFTFSGEPINPACVAMFNSSISDKPYLRAINLNQCQHSNAAYQQTHNSPEVGYFFYQNDKDIEGGQYSYQVIGKTTNGIYVLLTRSSGGGSLVSSDLLLTKIVNAREVTNRQSAQLKVDNISELKLLGYLSGGDRCVGDFKQVKVNGNNVEILQHAGSNPADCEKMKSYRVDLSAVG